MASRFAGFLLPFFKRISFAIVLGGSLGKSESLFTWNCPFDSSHAIFGQFGNFSIAAPSKSSIWLTAPMHRTPKSQTQCGRLAAAHCLQSAGILSPGALQFLFFEDFSNRHKKIFRLTCGFVVRCRALHRWEKAVHAAHRLLLFLIQCVCVFHGGGYRCVS